MYSDRFTDVAAKREDNDEHQELRGLSAVTYILFQKIPKSHFISNKDWLHNDPRKDELSMCKNKLQKQIFFIAQRSKTSAKTSYVPRALARLLVADQ